jgi:hypothetical protein
VMISGENITLEYAIKTRKRTNIFLEVFDGLTDWAN